MVTKTFLFYFKPPNLFRIFLYATPFIINKLSTYVQNHKTHHFELLYNISSISNDLKDLVAYHSPQYYLIIHHNLTTKIEKLLFLVLNHV